MQRFLLLIVIDVVFVQGRLFDRCELAVAIRGYRPSIDHSDLNRWVCIAQQQSKFDSSSVNVDPDGVTGYHGLFHISDGFWCAKTFADYFDRACHMTCQQLKDDNLLDDIVCAQRVYDEHQRISGNGFSAWPVSQTACANPPDLVSDCSPDRTSNAIGNNLVDTDIDAQLNSVTADGNGYHNNPFLNGKYGESTKDYRNNVFLAVKSGGNSYTSGRQLPAYTPPPTPKSSEKVYERCELARELRYDHNIPMNQIHTWVCIAKHESSFRTSVIGRWNADGSTDHGLFQISNLFWCSSTGRGKGCQAQCSDFENSDITDDIRCVRQIYDEHQRLFGNGFHAWAVYEPYCKHITKQFTKDCFDGVSEEKLSETTKATTLKSYSVAPKRKTATGKVFERCELARELRFQHNIPADQIHTWVCIAQHESSFRTSAIGRLNVDGSTDHGLFQISNLFWCETNEIGKACNAKCSDFEDSDITNDVNCVRQIYDEHKTLFGNGFHAWAVYEPHCRHVAHQFISDCFGDIDDEENLVTPTYEKTTVKRKIDGGKVYDRCELARELRSQHNLPLDEIHTWVCIAQRESDFRTYVLGGSEDYGLFQISSLYWCEKSGGAGKACDAKCSDFQDSDITDDVNCVRKIFDEHQRLFGNGFHAWTVYEPYCKQSTEKYVSDCFATTTDTIGSKTTPYTTTTQVPFHKNFSQKSTPRTTLNDRTPFSSTLGVTTSSQKVYRPLGYSVGSSTTTSRPTTSFTSAITNARPTTSKFTAYALNSIGFTTPKPITYTSTPRKSPFSFNTRPITSTASIHAPTATTYSSYTPTYSFRTRTSAPVTTTSPISAFKSTGSYYTSASPSKAIYTSTTPRPASFNYVSTPRRTTSVYTTPSPATLSSVNAIFDLYLNKWTKSTTPVTSSSYSPIPVNQLTATTPYHRTSYSIPYKASTPRPIAATITSQYSNNSSFSPEFSSTYSSQYTSPYKRTTRHTTEAIGVGSSKNVVDTDGMHVNDDGKWSTVSLLNQTLTKTPTKTSALDKNLQSKTVNITTAGSSTKPTGSSKPHSKTTPVKPKTSTVTAKSSHVRTETTTTKKAQQSKITYSTNKTVTKTPITSISSKSKQATSSKDKQSTGSAPSTSNASNPANGFSSTAHASISTTAGTVAGSNSTVEAKKSTPHANAKKPSSLIEKFKTSPNKITDSSGVKKLSTAKYERNGRNLVSDAETNIPTTVIVNTTASLDPKNSTTKNAGRYIRPPSTKNAGLYTPFSKHSWYPVKIPSATILQLQGMNVNLFASNLTKASYTSSQLTPLVPFGGRPFKPISSFSFGTNVTSSTRFDSPASTYRQ